MIDMRNAGLNLFGQTVDSFRQTGLSNQTIQTACNEARNAATTVLDRVDLLDNQAFNDFDFASIDGALKDLALNKKCKTNGCPQKPKPPKNATPLSKYDTVIQDQYGADAHVVDANTLKNKSTVGKLDRGDMISYVDPATGKTVTKAFGTNEVYDIQYRASMVDNSKALESKTLAGKIGFAENNASTQFNPQYWQNIGGADPLWQVKSGVTTSDAINDIFNAAGGNYSIDCNEAMQLTSLKSRLDTIGAEDFNNTYAKLAINTSNVYANTGSGLTLLPAGAFDSAAGDFTAPGDTTGLRPGDGVYFFNPYGNGTTQGENAIYLGKDQYGEPQFYGHPYGTFTGTEQEFGYLSQQITKSDYNAIAALDKTPQSSWA